MERGNGELFAVPVNLIVAENERKSVKLVRVKLFPCKLPDKLKLLLG